MTFCLPVLGGCGICQPCPWLLGSWFLPPRLPSYQVGIAVLHLNKPFKKAILLSDSVSARRGFKTHYGPWSTGGDHQTHITAADLRAPYTTLGYDFHDQVLFQLRIFIWHLNPGLCFSRCNWVLHLRPACWSDVRHSLGARWPGEGILFQWLPRGQVFFIIIVPAKSINCFNAQAAVGEKAREAVYDVPCFWRPPGLYIHSEWANACKPVFFSSFYSYNITSIIVTFISSNNVSDVFDRYSRDPCKWKRNGGTCILTRWLPWWW